mgnify:CR=1 FL=1
MNTIIGRDDIYEERKNTLLEEDVLFFQGEFLLAYSSIKTRQEIDTFHPYTQKVLLACMWIAFASPVPGWTIALSIPISVVWLKHRKKIIDILNKKYIQFFSEF